MPPLFPGLRLDESPLTTHCLLPTAHCPLLPPTLPCKRPEDRGEAGVVTDCVLTASRNGGATGPTQQGNVFRKQRGHRIHFPVRCLHHHFAKGAVVSVDYPAEGLQVFFPG